MLSYRQIFTRLFISLLLGGIIGTEREGIRKPAGLRTHILVCVSSSLIMLSGIYLSSLYINTYPLDPSRLGAQVISGIGFLGAGTILKVNNSVKGLTTAASLWSVAGIGLACGMGFYSGAVACTALILFSLNVFSKIERLIKNKSYEASLEIICENNLQNLKKIERSLENKKIRIIQIESSILNSNNTIEVKFLIILPKNMRLEEIINFIIHIDGIKNIKIE